MSDSLSWPAWAADEALARRHSGRLARRLWRRVRPRRLAREWQELADSPVRLMPEDARSFLQTRSRAIAVREIEASLELLWRDAWILGAVTAYRLAGSPPGTKTASVTGEQRPVTCDLGHDHDSHAAAGLLIRSRDENGKRIYLLHKNPEGSWLTPGGGLHVDEAPWNGAIREATEEMGTLPALRRSHSVVQDHGNWQYTTFVMDASEPFTPSMDGTTPDEVTGWGWFRKREVRDLDLAPGLDDGWDAIRHSDGDTVIDGAAEKAWRYRRLLPGVENPGTPRDARRSLANRLMRAGIPATLAVQLAGRFLAWEETAGTGVRHGIVHTLTSLITRILQQQGAGTLSEDDARAELDEALGEGPRSSRIAITEVTRASQLAAMEIYAAAGVPYVRWMTARDARVCNICAGNWAAGPVRLGAPFPSGDLAPPAHPNCRCAIVPAEATVPAEVKMPADDWLGKSALTPELSTVHRPLGHEGLWHTPSKKVPVMQQLPAYVQNVARALMRDQGMEESRAIATAINAIKEWAAGRAWGGKVKVTPTVRRAARRAIAEWEALRASHKHEFSGWDGDAEKCLTCGCHRPDDEHDDERNITMSDLQGAADWAGITTRQAILNIIDTTRAMPVDGNPWAMNTNQRNLEACG